MAEESRLVDFIPEVAGGFFEKDKIGSLQDDLEGFPEAPSDRLGQKGDDHGAADLGDHAGKHGSAGPGTGELLGGPVPVRLQPDEHDALVGLPGRAAGKGDRGEKDPGFRVVRGDFLRLADILVGGFAGGTFRGDDHGNDDALVLLREKLLGNEAVEQDGQGKDAGAEAKPNSPVAQGGIEAAGIKQIELFQAQFEPAKSPRELVRDRAEKMGAQGGAEAERDKSGDGHGSGEGDGELAKKDAGGSFLESNRQKDDDKTGGDGEDRPGDFLHGLAAGFQGRHSRLDVAHDVLEHDDGVVHDDADGQDEGEEGENVDAVTEQIKQGKGPENGDGDGCGGNQGGPEIAKKEKDEKNDQNRGNADGLGHFPDGRLDIQGGIEGEVEADVGGKKGADPVNLLAHLPGHLDGVGIRLFDDAKAHGGFAIEAGDGGLHLRADFHGGHLPEADGRAVDLADKKIRILFRTVHAAAGDDAEGAAFPLDPSGGEFDVFPAKKGADIGRGDFAGGHFLGIEPDPHGGSFLSPEVDAADAREHLEAIADLAFGQIGELEGGPVLAVEGDPHDLLGVGVLFGHDGLLDVVG